MKNLPSAFLRREVSMILNVPADCCQGYYVHPHQRQSRWRAFAASFRQKPSRHHCYQMASSGTLSPEIQSLERMRQADDAGPAHGEALAEDAIIWASLNGLVHLLYKH